MTHHHGEILAPEHPVFSRPHAFDKARLGDVHGGSIYRAFYGLGEGWTPLLSAGKEQAWDKSAAADDGPHYGIVELPHGEGRILLVQMIPSYHWFHDSDGEAGCAGARFFENLVHYALGRAPARAGGERGCDDDEREDRKELPGHVGPRVVWAALLRERGAGPRACGSEDARMAVLS